MTKRYDTPALGRGTTQEDPWAKPLANLRGVREIKRPMPTPRPLTIIGRIQSWIRRISL